MSSIDVLESIIAYRFRDRAFALEALTHASLGPDRLSGRRSNTWLAYLGDAVIELALRAKQLDEHPRDSTGVMTDSKQGIVSKEALGRRAIDLGLGDVLERSTTHAVPDATERVWGEALEAVVGAVFRDAGFEVAARLAVDLLYRPDVLQAASARRT